MSDVGAFNTKTPPSKHAMACLDRAWVKPYPAQEVNFTVRDKLMAWGYVDLVDMPSPYATHKAGRTVPHLVITDAGRAALNRKESS